MKQVYVARDASEANWIRSALERAGIEAVVRGDQPEDAVPELPTASSCPSVQVRDADEADARVLVEGWSRQSEEESVGVSWICPDCGEENRDQDFQCRRCGHTRVSGD